MKTSPAGTDDQQWLEGGVGSCRLRVRVVPRASRTEIVGPVAGALKVRLCAPPLDDRANQELVEVLAATTGCPRRSVIIRSGLRSRNKVVEILGASHAALVRAFGQQRDEA